MNIRCDNIAAISMLDEPGWRTRYISIYGESARQEPPQPYDGTHIRVHRPPIGGSNDQANNIFGQLTHLSAMGVGEFAPTVDFCNRLIAILLTLRGSFATTTLLEFCINYAHIALPQHLCSQDLSLSDSAYYSFATAAHTELCLNYSHRALPQLRSDSFASTTLFQHSFLHHALRALPTTGYHGLPQATTSSE